MSEIGDHAEQAVAWSANAAPVAAPVTVLPAGMERRRPGRREHVDPALIPLLRRTPELDATLPAFDLENERQADRAPSRGILIGLILSALIWVTGVAIVAFLLT